MRGLLETYEHTGRRLFWLGVGLLVVLAVAVGASAFATTYAIQHPPRPAIVGGIIGPASFTGLLFALSSVIRSVARILEVRNQNPAVCRDTTQGRSPSREPALDHVGVAGFEPTTSSSRTKRATKLRHTPRRAEQ
jgi:hypothetical protein